jgi:hypothetical protein
MTKQRWFQPLITLAIIAGISALLFMYTSGYRIVRKDDKTIDVAKTGMVSAKSIPEGSSVYLNGVLMTATNDTISGIEPGIHNLKIMKKGFVTWEKSIEVFPELVTDITGVLISQSPRLEPLTNSGAKFHTMSPTLTKLAYFSQDSENPGVRILSLAQESLNLFRTSPETVLKDTPQNIYSTGKSIEWSPDEKQLLITGASDNYYIVNLEDNTIETTTTVESIKKLWADEEVKKKNDFIEKFTLTEEIKKIAVLPSTVWSPDGKKFLYTSQNGQDLEYKVYNMEEPLPVGEKVETVVFTTKASDPQPKVTWYADSYHLIIADGFTEENKRASVYLIRIDGTNKTELYNNTLYSDRVYSSPSGDKIIMLTSFKSGEQTDLYTISIR